MRNKLVMHVCRHSLCGLIVLEFLISACNIIEVSQNNFLSLVLCYHLPSSDIFFLFSESLIVYPYYIDFWIGVFIPINKNLTVDDDVIVGSPFHIYYPTHDHIVCVFFAVDLLNITTKLCSYSF